MTDDGGRRDFDGTPSGLCCTWNDSRCLCWSGCLCDCRGCDCPAFWPVTVKPDPRYL